MEKTFSDNIKNIMSTLDKAGVDEATKLTVYIALRSVPEKVPKDDICVYINEYEALYAKH
jgi:hypothetical protein